MNEIQNLLMAEDLMTRSWVTQGPDPARHRGMWAHAQSVIHYTSSRSLAVLYDRWWSGRRPSLATWTAVASKKISSRPRCAASLMWIVDVISWRSISLSPSFNVMNIMKAHDGAVFYLDDSDITNVVNYFTLFFSMMNNDQPRFSDIRR